jgi:hypothetical protein
LSNVLIGIIGVILFIGLALAGALILGDDFLSASNSSKASTIMAQMKQIVDAAEMRKLKLGISTTPSTDPSFLMPRFLKVVPTPPTSYASANPTTYLYQYGLNNNVYPDAIREPQYGAKYVQLTIGPNTDSKTKGICETIADMSSGGTIYTGTDNPPTDMGCGNFAGYYIAFLRLESASMSGTIPTGL